MSSVGFRVNNPIRGGGVGGKGGDQGTGWGGRGGGSARRGGGYDCISARSIQGNQQQKSNLEKELSEVMSLGVRTAGKLRLGCDAVTCCTFFSGALSPGSSWGPPTLCTREGGAKTPCLGGQEK